MNDTQMWLMSGTVAGVLILAAVLMWNSRLERQRHGKEEDAMTARRDQALKDSAAMGYKLIEAEKQLNKARRKLVVAKKVGSSEDADESRPSWANFN